MGHKRRAFAHFRPNAVLLASCPLPNPFIPAPSYASGSRGSCQDGSRPDPFGIISGIVFRQSLAFLTTESNDIVRPIHAKAMPVLLTNDDEWNTWLDDSLEKAIALQPPLPNETLRIVATREKADLARVEE